MKTRCKMHSRKPHLWPMRNIKFSFAEKHDISKFSKYLLKIISWENLYWTDWYPKKDFETTGNFSMTFRLNFMVLGVILYMHFFPFEDLNSNHKKTIYLKPLMKKTTAWKISKYGNNSVFGHFWRSVRKHLAFRWYHSFDLQNMAISWLILRMLN